MRSVMLAVVIALLALPVLAATEKRLDGAKPIVVRPAEATVTIDVKDAEVVTILKDMQKQCGIKNLMIDPNVKGKGTFYLVAVPCRQAWSVVLRSMGLDSVSYPNSVATVGKRRH